MADTVRMNLTVAADIPEKLLALAGSQRKMGEWLTDMIRQAYEQQTSGEQVPPEVTAFIQSYMKILGYIKQFNDDTSMFQEFVEFKKWKETQHGIQ